MEYIRFSNKKSGRNRVCPQTSVSTKTELIKFRAEKHFKNKIKEISKEKKLSISEMSRILWENYIKTYDKIAWEKEIAEWKKN